MKKWMLYNRKYFYPKYHERKFTKFVKQNNGNGGLIGCEIGVREGNNLFSMLYHLDIEKMYAVDVSFLGRLKDKRVVYLEGKGVDMHKFIPDNSLDFCYIDSSHVYDDTIQEIHLYFLKVKKGGLLGGHDFPSSSGVTKAVLEFVNKYDYKLYGGLDDWVVKI